MLDSIKNSTVRAVEKVFGTKYERDMKRIGPIVDEINEYFEEYKSLSDDDLRGMTEKLREELAEGAELEDVLPRAYAVVKETCRRHVGKSWEVVGQTVNWDMVPYDVQLVGGIVLHEGRIAEMATGEGKTLVALMPLYLNALTGKGAHLVTVNDYLAQRDREWVGPILEYLGLTIGVIKHDMTPPQRRQSYGCDITYGTNNEFGFDYLRDNMAIRAQDQVQRGHHYAIIDEVDNILIDEARTPLIISGPVTQTHQNFSEMKPTVERVVRSQTSLVTGWMSQIEKALAEEGENPSYETATRLLQIKRGAPKNRRFVKLLSDSPGLQKDIRKVEFDAIRDKRMNEIDAELYYTIEEKNREIDTTEKGRQAMAPGDPEMFVLPDLAMEVEEIEAREDLDPKERVTEKEKAFRRYAERADRIHSVMQLLRAYSLYEKDVDYVVQDGKVLIVDEFTGRLMAGRRWSDGLHQAVEAKEGVTVEGETQTFATITLQNYFRLYDKISGMTGTAETEATEFWEIYKLDVVKIPTHRPVNRMDHDDLIYRTRREKYNAIVDEVKALNEVGRPVLVGTTNVEVSETLSRLMKRQGIRHNVLNAKHHQREAEIVARAGEMGAVTIATNMAGRGTDIKLGEGVLPNSEKRIEGARDDEGDMGLAIIGSERHESRRIDRQLRGRSGRQGDPGSSRFFLSLEDDLMRLFGSERIAGVMQKLGAQEGEVIEHRWVTRAVGNAQKKVEEQNFSIRKRLLEYDDVMNKQREVVYGIRGRVLRGESMKDDMLDYLDGVVADQVEGHVDPSERITMDVVKLVAAELEMLFVSPMSLEGAFPGDEISKEGILEHFQELARAAYERRENDWGEEITREVERRVMLSIIDDKWRDHLYEMDMLKEGIGLRAWGQKDPLIEYKREAFITFENMMASLGEDIIRRFFRVQVAREARPDSRPEAPAEPAAAPRPVPTRATQESHAAFSAFGPQAPTATATSAPPAAAEPVRVGKKVGRNDPCPCGSGKKYKKCHGKAA
jgi:preprotein translocase subunit SecA